MDGKWTPPSDAIPVAKKSSWQPPSDAILVKKKDGTTGSPHNFLAGDNPTPQDLQYRKELADAANGSGQLNNGSKTSQNTKKEVFNTFDQKALENWGKRHTPTDIPLDHIPAKQYKQSNTKSWLNLPKLAVNNTFSGLDKDAANVFGFLKDKLSNPFLFGSASQQFGALEDVYRKEQLVDEQRANQHQLPNNTAGNIATDITKMGSDLVELATTPEFEIANFTKLGKYSKIVNKGVNYLVGKFPIQQASKEMMQKYADARKDNKSESDANLEALKGFGQGYKNGLVFEVAGNGASKLTEFGVKALDKAGLMAANNFIAGGEKRLLNSMSQGLAFSTAPVIQNALEGKPTDWEEIKKNGLFGVVLGALHGGETNKEVSEKPTTSDQASAQILMRKPIIDLDNFINTDVKDIIDTHNSDHTSADFLAKSTVNADKGFNSEDEQEKAKFATQSSLFGKAASVKSITEAIMNDKEGLVDEVNQMDIPDDAKKQAIDKINEVHKEIDPKEKEKTAIGNKITEIDNKIKLMQDDETDPVKNAEKNVLLKQKLELQKELEQKIIDNQKPKKNENETQTNPVADNRQSETESSEENVGGSTTATDSNTGEESIKGRNDEENLATKGQKVADGGDEPPLAKPRYTIKGEQVTPKDNDTQNKINKDNQLELSEPTDSKDNQQKQVKKTILTKRAYEGNVSNDVKKYLEEKGLTRSSYSQKERAKQATDFIKEFGDEAAIHAVDTNDIKGGMAASILAQLQVKINKQMAELPLDSEERDILAKKYADLVNIAEQKGYWSGEYAGQLAYEYQNTELNYANIKKQVEKTTGKKLTTEQEKHINNVLSENEKLKKQFEESEAKLIEETDKAFQLGKEEAKNETKAQKAKKIANTIRANAKIHRPGIYSAATPVSLLWDTSVEIVAKAIETGGSLADAIDLGLNHIKESEWYKSLSDNKKNEAEKEFKKFHNENFNSKNLEDLQERFLDKKDNNFTPNEAKSIWNYMKESYINNGTSYIDAISKTSKDLGLSWSQIGNAIISPKMKRTTDEFWKKQADYSRNRIAIRDWVENQNKSKFVQQLNKISGLFRGVAVFGHGGIFIGTHAGMTLFSPSQWDKVLPAFINGWKFAYGDNAKYEMAMQDLQNSPNYVIAQRAGLKNNPERLNSEEYQKSQKYLGKLGTAGEKGFNAIKVLRQKLFDYHYDNLSAAEKDDPSAVASIAQLINLATGATNSKIPSWVNEVTFAGGMELSRWQKLTSSPLKASKTALKALINPDKVSTADKVFAKVWARRVGEQIGVYTSAMLLNGAIQKMINPKNPVNYTDPNKPDFLKFKFGDFTVDMTSGMRGVGMFIYEIGKIPTENKKKLHGEDKIGALGSKSLKYARGKLAPFYGTLADFYSGTDFKGNTLPNNNEKPNKGKHKLTYQEYISSKLPLPVAETFNVMYESAYKHTSHKITTDAIIKGIIAGGASGATGFRVNEEDYSIKNKK